MTASVLFQTNTRKDAKYSLKASYVEIYNEGVYDLIHFQQKTLPVKWDASYGFYVQVGPWRRSWQACAHAGAGAAVKKPSGVLSEVASAATALG